VADVIDRLDNIHILLDTSGYASDQDFRRVVERCDQVYYDIKLIDRDAHRHYTGCDNNLILNNLQVLSELGVPFVIRVPLVPGVTDTDENLAAIARIVRGLPGLQQVDLLPYNRVAGAKYRFAGMEFKPGYDESRELNLKTAPFEWAGVKVRVA
jgi:pyruvate formate lyase activating enzyme